MKNTHLEHPEDSILNGDLSVLDWFTAGGNLSVKIDGAPAIVWGTNPANGKFFVGTKSVFNKVKIKINHSHEEIDANHEGKVAIILHACFDCLPRSNTIYQGDFIGFGGDDTYRPNTITYIFDEVIDQEIIIAPHTIYYADHDLRDAVAEPLDEKFKDTDRVKFVQPKCWQMDEDYTDVIAFARQMSTLVNFVSDKEAAKIKKQINACIREQRDINPEDFDCDRLLIEYWKLIKSIKDDITFLCRNNGPKAYIGDKQCSGEGYVMSNEFGMFKLVNREGFSYANFTMEKTW